MGGRAVPGVRGCCEDSASWLDAPPSRELRLPKELRKKRKRPRRIGELEILGEIGRGGGGVVYRAWDRQLDRHVAVKVFQDPGGRREKARLRFLQEARVLARLRHPNVVRVHTAGAVRGRPYLVMELVEGESLEDVLRREGTLAPERAVLLVRKLALALEAVHQLGVLHRDVKPANVLLGPDGEPRLTDFGVALDQTVDLACTRLTPVGTLIGTPDYWAPEQIVRGRPQLGPEVDVYGLGATLYALLTGQPPFSSQTLLQSMVATEKTMPDPPSGRRRSLPQELDQICLKCLAKDPRDRYRRAVALASELEHYLAASSSRGRRRPAPSSRAIRSSRAPRGSLPPLGSLLLVVFLVGGPAWIWRSALSRALANESTQLLQEHPPAEAHAALTVAVNQSRGS